MNRVFAAVLVLSLALCAGSASWGQEFAGTDGSFGGNYVESYPGFAYGPPGNRWAAYYANPYAAPIYPTAPYYQAPYEAQFAPGESPVVARGRRQPPPAYRRGLRRGQAILPNGAPPAVYFVPSRDQTTRGWGYGIGPYGTDYYSGMYKGLVIP